MAGWEYGVRLPPGSPPLHCLITTPVALPGQELLLLDPHGLYLPLREESINANLWDLDNEFFHRAQEAWPDTVAPFVAVTNACADVMPPLRLPRPGADGPPGDEQNGSALNLSPPAPLLTPDDHEAAGAGGVAEPAPRAACSPGSDGSKRKRGSRSDDGTESMTDGGNAMIEGIPAAGEFHACVNSDFVWHNKVSEIACDALLRYAQMPEVKESLDTRRHQWAHSC